MCAMTKNTLEVVEMEVPDNVGSLFMRQRIECRKNTFICECLLENNRTMSVRNYKAFIQSSSCP
jgi:hypothetical protein